MAGRSVHEKVYGELKSGFAFACVPTMQYAANSAWQLLTVLAFNLSRSFQLATTARAPRLVAQTPDALRLQIGRAHV